MLWCVCWLQYYESRLRDVLLQPRLRLLGLSNVNGFLTISGGLYAHRTNYAEAVDEILNLVARQLRCARSIIIFDEVPPTP